MSQFSIGIFGLGRFGTALVHTLNNLDAGKSIHLRIIDNDPEKVEPLRGVTDDQLIVDFDNEDETTLKKHFQGLDVAVIALGSYIFFVLCAIASSRYAWAYLHLWAQSRVMEEQVLSGSGRVGAAAPRGLAVAHAIMHLDGRIRREARRLWFVSARVLRTHTQDNV